MSWNDMKQYRERSQRDMFDDFDEDALERAYKRGCKEGYRKAQEEIRGGAYGERDGGFGNRSWTISEGHRGGSDYYGHRNDDDEMMGDYSERRYRDSRGRYR